MPVAPWSPCLFIFSSIVSQSNSPGLHRHLCAGEDHLKIRSGQVHTYYTRACVMRYLHCQRETLDTNACASHVFSFVYTWASPSTKSKCCIEVECRMRSRACGKTGQSRCTEFRTTAAICSTKVLGVVGGTLKTIHDTSETKRAVTQDSTTH